MEHRLVEHVLKIQDQIKVVLTEYLLKNPELMKDIDVTVLTSLTLLIGEYTSLSLAFRTGLMTTEDDIKVTSDKVIDLVRESIKDFSKEHDSMYEYLSKFLPEDDNGNTRH